MAKDAKKKSGAAAQGRAGQGGRIKITQIGSPIGRRHDQRETLIGLGLNKINRTRVLEDTAAVRGMVEKVQHLVKVEPAA